MRLLSLVFVGISAAGWAGCTSGSPSPEAEPPPLPAVEAAAFPKAAQDALRETLLSLETSSQDADQNGRLGALLHAYGRLAKAVDCYRRAESFDPARFRWPYLSGVALAEQGKAEEAVVAFQQALSIEARPGAQVRLAQTLQSLGRVQESREAYEEALQLDSRSAAALYGLGRLLLEDGAPLEAVPILRKALELAPSSGAVRYSLGLALRDAGSSGDSEAMLASAESLNRSLPPLDDPLMREVEALRRDEHWLLNEGKRREDSGDLAEAVALYREALELAPDFGSAEANLVGAYGKLGQTQEAEKHYRRALEVAPNMEELHNNWGVIQGRLGNAAAARQSFRRALELNPYSVDANFNLGVALAASGEADEAVRLLTRAIEHQPNHRLAQFQLGRLLVLQGRLDEGIRRLKAAADDPQDPVRPAALYALGEAYLRDRQVQNAEDSFARALAAAEAAGQQDLALSIRASLRDLTAKARP